jgi:hypothetical protein
MMPRPGQGTENLEHRKSGKGAQIPEFLISRFAASVRLFPLLLAALTSSATPTNYPSWWLDRGVLATNGVTTNDYAAVNAGQLKWVAAKAREELDAHLPGGAGSNVAALVTGFSTSNNYPAINLGQLKAVAAPFYDRLIAEGYATNYPWTTNTADDANYAAANIGQLKFLFSFDLRTDTDGDGLADWVETATGVYVGPGDTGSDPNTGDSDGDGLSDGAEVQASTDPNSNDRTAPNVRIQSPGNAQRFLRLP